MHPVFWKDIQKVVLLLVGIIWSLQSISQPSLLENAHSHNDYNRKIPLLDAMTLGFKSIEADILLIENELYVGHDMPIVTKKLKLPSLKQAYLQPLDSLVKQGNGKLYADSDESLLLLVDIKTDAVKTLDLLQHQLRANKDVITYWEEVEMKKGAVNVVISGNRSFEKVMNAKVRMVSLDGRPEDLGKGYSSEMMPLISQRYAKIVKWNGKGEIKPKELKKLKELTSKAHKEGKLVRLWASPESENVWETLLDAGVDLINTDEIEHLKKFLDKRGENP